MSLNPIYTHANCSPAYQLNWGLTLFWNSCQKSDDWLPALKEAVEVDGVRILKHGFSDSDSRVSQFFLSTTPAVAPVQFVRSVKGRLQHLVRQAQPKAFQRNYAFRSIGAVRREVVDRYVAGQIEHHPAADPLFEERLRKLQIQRPEIDLASARRNAYGQYWYAVHIVLTNSGRWRECGERELELVRSTVLGVARKHGHLLARAAILPDHLHLELGCEPGLSPGDAALSYMNNLAYHFGMRPVLEAGYYVGTVGEYDRGAIE